MTSYIEQHNLLYPSQYGFRKGHSTQHAILDIINDIQANMNQRLLSCGVFIDLKKAFDTVDHKILLNKLNHYGFRGIINDWFSSYLNNRTQTTQVGQHISDKAIITCGVPQGYVFTTQNVTTRNVTAFNAKCNYNAKCNNVSTQNVTIF